MNTVYIIAGPPGIGKSTSGRFYIPKDVNIIDADLIVERYRAEGFKDFEAIGNMRFNQLVRQQLINGNNFAIELNLGFQSHYDYVKSIKAFSSENTIEVILFYTDDLNLCHQRAQVRYEEGLHHVPRETIDKMYKDTFSLLQQNFNIISNLTAISVVGNDEPIKCLRYIKAKNSLDITAAIPDWAQGLKDFLEVIQLDRRLIVKQSLAHNQLARPKETSKKKSRGKKL